ncbi:MAG: OmpA family protein [Desulfobacteraceae bacterium]|nr:OmpA family protein [Desulfobacteraceae bacterium]
MKDKADEAAVESRDQEPTTLDELRNLLVGPEQIQIGRLKERLDDPGLHAEDVSRVLAEAIALRSSRDGQVAKALEPSIEETLKASVGRNPKPLVEALFPVMGPAIGKAIFSAVRGMIQSVNQFFENNLSLQGVKWRLEAFRTKKPFPEIVSRHTLIYQVEHVFLIHRNTGSVLQHVVAKDVATQGPDQVSGMREAIQDFFQDASDVEKDQDLESLRIGDRNLWVELGPHAILAAVIRENPPPDLEGVFRETIETIHLMKSEALESFDGDVSPFEDLNIHLEGCLQSQLKESKRKISPQLWLLLGIVVLAITLWISYSMRDQRRWSNYVNRLRSEPGIVVTATEKRSGKYYIFGLRDPLAAEPKEMLKHENLDPEDVVFQWEAYRAHHPEFILTRARKLLQPPETVTLDLKEGVLQAEGYAPPQWAVEARKLVMAIPGVFQFNGDRLKDQALNPAHILAQAKESLDPPGTVSLTLKDNVLYASGSASHGWITSARERAKSLSGIARFQEDNLVDLDQRNLAVLKESIEGESLRFGARSTRPASPQESAIGDLVGKIRQLNDSAEALGKRARIEIIGHTDSSGNERANLIISHKRAQHVLSLLVSEGLQSSNFITKGQGSKDPLKEERSQEDKEANRRVTFRVILADKSE